MQSICLFCRDWIRAQKNAKVFKMCCLFSAQNLHGQDFYYYYYISQG